MTTKYCFPCLLDFNFFSVEPKPVSWASLASKNAPPSQPSTTSAGPAGHAQPLGKTQATRSDVKLDMNQGPQPQRAR